MDDDLKTITKATLRALAKRVGVTEGEVRDPQCPGLSVRIRAREAVWTLRGRLVGKQSTWRIGPITNEGLADPAEARRRAVAARDMLARGLDPAQWLKEQERGGKMVRTGDAERDGLLWPEAVAAFLADKATHRSPKTIVDYKNTLHLPAIGNRFDQRPLRSVSPREVKAVVKSIERAGKKAQAQHVLRVVKSLFSWAAMEDHLGDGDDVRSPLVGVKITRHKAATGYVPTPDELGALFWQLNAAPLHSGVRFAAALVALTAQRRETVVSAKWAELSALPDMPGWGRWAMEPDPLIESDRLHVIPLPPMTWLMVRAARMAAGGGPWLFPQARLRRQGDEGGGYLSAKAVADAMQSAAGDHVSPHDMRRGLATHGVDVLKMRDDDVKRILNHAHGRSDVTGRSYALHQSMPWKIETMAKWESWLVGLVRAAAPQAGMWPDFLPEPVPAQVAPLLLEAPAARRAG